MSAYDDFTKDETLFTTDWHRHLHNLRLACHFFSESLSVHNPHGQDIAVWLTEAHQKAQPVIAWEMEHGDPSMRRSWFDRVERQVFDLLNPPEEPGQEEVA